MATRYRKQAYRDENRLPSGSGLVAAQYGWPSPEPSAYHQSKLASSTASESGVTAQEADTHNPKSAHFSKRYPCTFKGCGRRFDEKQSLAKHKDSEHDYCMTCDLDFEDDEALHVHKMQSTMHIICPICGIDFKSEPGRDRHTKQMHSTQQNVTCRGCHKAFAKGAALLQHFEQNQCAPLMAYNNPDELVHGKQMLEAQRAMMAMELSMQQKEDLGKIDWDSTIAGDESIVTESAEGGVRIQPSLMDDPVMEQEFGGIDRLQPALVSSINNSDNASMISSSTIQGHGGNWPVVGASAAKGKGKAEWNETGRMDRRMSTLSNSTWSKDLFPDAPATPASGYIGTPSAKLTADSLNSVNPSESGVNLLPAGRLLEPDILDNVFHCIFPKCEHSTLDRDSMIAHMKTHKGQQNRCPCCFRIFKSASAVTAHMESASTRCNIRQTKGYGNAITLASGGFLALGGRHEDGTVMMTSEKMPEPLW